MFRKLMTVSILGFVLAGSLISTAPANAATKISNGVLCPKANAKQSVGGTVYKCTKNPFVNKTKNTWTSSDCISTAATYTSSNASYLALVAGMPAALADLDAKIVAEQAKVVESATKADALDAQIVVWRAKIVSFTAAKDALLAKPNPSTFVKAISTYTIAIHSLNSAIAGNTTASATLRKVGKTVTTMQAQRAATVASVTQANDAVAQALKLRNLICDKGL